METSRLHVVIAARCSPAPVPGSKIAVNKSVDNRHEMRITARFLWISSWMAEEPEMPYRRPLRDAHVCSRNTLPLKTGTTRGRPRERGKSRATGPHTGTWPRRAARGAGKARQLTSRCGEAGQGPSISYMEGPCLILPGRDACLDPHAAAGGTPAAMTWIAVENGEVPGGRAATAGGMRGSRRAGRPASRWRAFAVRLHARSHPGPGAEPRGPACRLLLRSPGRADRLRARRG
jgi:hypothetical protein